MKIRFLGTAAAEGVPAMFCNCEFCREVRKLGEQEFRTRSQVLIDDILSIDFPPEAYAHSLKFGVQLSNLKYILATHSHMDHFYAHDFILRGYKYAEINSAPLEIFGNSEVLKVFNECTAREMKPEVLPNLQLNEIKPYQKLRIGKFSVLTIPAQHSKTEDCLLFYIEKEGKGYLHLHDTGRICGEAFDFLAINGARADIVAFDCTFGEATGGAVSRHMGIEDNMIMRDMLQSRGIIDKNSKLVITHFSHNCSPLRKNLKKLEDKFGVIAAYDGMEIEI